MVILAGRKIPIRAQRECVTCHALTWQICYGIRYENPDPTADHYLKHMFWACERCSESSEELKDVPEPTDRLVLIKRLLKVGEDYDVKSVSIQSDANAVTLRVEFPSYDPARLRRLAYKLEEGFINIAELMELHEAGFRTEQDREKLLRDLCATHERRTFREQHSTQTWERLPF